MTTGSGSKDISKRISNRPRPLADFVPGLTKDVFGRQNMLFGKMIAGWRDIAGAEMAACTMPLDLKISRSSKDASKSSQAVLQLAVQPAYALEFSYQKNLLIERLNAFFGYAAVKDIKIVQNSEVMNKKAVPIAKTRLLTQQENQNIDHLVTAIEESDLQTALKNLGKAILSRQDKKA